jgi:hypothetical protein
MRNAQLGTNEESSGEEVVSSYQSDEVDGNGEEVTCEIDPSSFYDKERQTSSY